MATSQAWIKSYTLFFSFLAVLPLIATAFDFEASHVESRKLRSGSGLVWAPCYDNTECGTFPIPRDWNNGYAGNISLAVIRYKATASPRLGTLWVNPGGPGLSGVEFIASGMGKRISTITGGYYDVASWDPRGVNNSLPRITCFATDLELRAVLNNTLLGTGIEVTGNFSVKADVTTLYNYQNGLNDLLDGVASRCEHLTGGGDLTYLGTVATVNDLVALTNVTDGVTASVNFWGFGYGTIIGTYLANIYPERAGRMVLDGVIDPVLYAQSPSQQSWGTIISDAEKALRGFSDACAIAGDSACAVSGSNNATEIFDWVVELVGAAYMANKQGIPGSSSAQIRSTLYQALATPRSWASLAEWLAAKAKQVGLALGPLSDVAEKRDLTGLNDTFAPAMAILDPPFVAISCGDSPDPVYGTKDVFDAVVNVTRTGSQLFGPQAGFSSMWYCDRWRNRAVQRYVGPWNSTLKNSVLVVGNEADPITPLSSARALVEQWGGNAVLVEQQGYGHTSFAMHSDCTQTAIGTYFISGQLPENGMTCSTNQPLFSNSESVADVALVGKVVVVPVVPPVVATSWVTARHTPEMGSAVVGALVMAVLW